MAVSMETQRLISVSLGKIAQSRGQRGGINLHKNLLVATVLHKARNAYMIESYSYQQNLHRQKLLEQYQLQQNTIPGQKVEASPVAEPNKGEPGGPVSRDCNQPICATPPAHEQSRSDVSSESATGSSPHESMSGLDTQVAVVQDKENSPPSVEDRLIIVPDNTNSSCSEMRTPSDSHMVAAAQLSHDAQMASCDNNNWKQQQQTSTSGGTTCNVLKRRRDNPNASVHDFDSPVSKVAKVQHHDSSTSYSTHFSADSPDDSRSDQQTPHHSESHQILNLVTIFNSGFAGLCASSSELNASSYQSDFDISSSQSLHTRKIATKAG